MIGNLIKQRRLELGMTQEELAHKLGYKSKSSINKEEAKRVVKSFDDLLEKGSIEDVRTAIKSLIDRIEVDGENVYIYWSFD